MTDEAINERIAFLCEQIEWYRQLQCVIEQEEYNHGREIEHWAAGGRIEQMRAECAWLLAATGYAPVEEYTP